MAIAVKTQNRKMNFAHELCTAREGSERVLCGTDRSEDARKAAVVHPVFEREVKGVPLTLTVARVLHRCAWMPCQKR